MVGGQGQGGVKGWSQGGGKVWGKGGGGVKVGGQGRGRVKVREGVKVWVKVMGSREGFMVGGLGVDSGGQSGLVGGGLR